MPQGRQGHPLTQHGRVHAFGDDALGDLDAVGVAASIAAGEISAREATEAAIARIERVDPALNAVVVRDFERALERSAAPAPGVLSGVPTIVKDNTDLAGLPTRQGSAAVPATPASADAPFTTQLLSTGVVPLGKSTMPEFGFNASTEFATDQQDTRNPWNTEYSAGASSGGSAALVAAGALPIAHANDGGGSIRIPAAACGLVGLKPTRGRVVDAVEAKTLPVNILSNGVVTRTVRDTAHFLAGAEAHQPATGLPPVGLVEGPSDRRLRIGLILDSVRATTDAETRAAVETVARELEKLGHTVDDVPLPVGERFETAFIHYWSMLAFATQKFGRRVMAPGFDASRTDPLTQYLSGRFLRNAWRTPGAIRTLKRSEKVYRRSMADAGVDVVLSPTVGHTTPKLGHLSPAGEFPEMFERLLGYAVFTPLHNAAGAPGVSLPLGRTAEGLPIGVHLSAMHGEERTLLELSYELEAVMPFARIQD